MIDIQSFDAVYHFDRQHHYAPSVREAINHHRRELGGQLFFDRLLASLRIDDSPATSSAHRSTTTAQRLYPPANNRELRELHRRIVAADVSEHWQLSALYYLLRDSDGGQTDSGGAGGLAEWPRAEEFAKRCLLPEKYRVCVEGLWLLDRLILKQALDRLTLPSLLPAFSEDVLRVLLQHAPSQPENRILPLAFHEAVRPPLHQASLLDVYFRYLCTLSLSAALSFLRARAPTHARQQLLEALIASALTEEHGKARAARAVEMLELPLSEEESGWFEQYLLQGDGKGLHGARDSVMMRRVAMGRMGDTEEVGRALSGRKIDGISWEEVKHGLGRGVGERGDGFGSLFQVDMC